MQCKITTQVKLEQIVIAKAEICGNALERATNCLLDTPPIILVDTDWRLLHGSRYVHAALDLQWEFYPSVLICDLLKQSERRALEELDNLQCDCCLD